MDGSTNVAGIIALDIGKRDELTHLNTRQQNEVSTHRSAKTHASNVFVTPDLDLGLPM